MRLKLLIGSAVAVAGLVAGTGVASGVGAASRPAPDGGSRTSAVTASAGPGAGAAVDPAARVSSGLRRLRAATDAFHSIAVAEQHHYALLTDAKGIACIDTPAMNGMPAGGMGVHWANSSLVGDPAIVPDQPEALVYAPMPDGTLQLAAVEYVVLKQAWDATHKHPPVLFGQTFNFTDAPNRYGLPPFYSLHVWVWAPNPAGMFAMWNPRVVC